jgi:hypothetical protein
MIDSDGIEQTPGQSEERFSGLHNVGHGEQAVRLDIVPDTNQEKVVQNREDVFETEVVSPAVKSAQNVPDDASFSAGISEPEQHHLANPEKTLDDCAQLGTAEPESGQLFQYWTQPEIYTPTRRPHLGDLGLLGLIAFFGLLVASVLTRAALYFHLFGISTVQNAVTDVHYTLGSEAVLYLFTTCACMLVFPLVWHKSFFAGMHWNGTTAMRMRQRLFGAASVCFVIALLNGILLPGPADTPIDKVFRAPGAAWLLFAFGTTFAPFFEETVFRGFLLPAVCTACDWMHERATDAPARPLDENGHPQWSMPAMGVASVAVSIPFALMHAEQTGHAVGPFLLLVCVSVVLCWARLSTRSLAASVLVHASYNFLLFSLMLLGTSGFQHLDKM